MILIVRAEPGPSILPGGALATVRHPVYAMYLRRSGFVPEM